jgi:hypothetical protein
MKLKLSIMLLLMIGGAKAQTISPVTGECGLSCKGEFTITNNQTKPMVAVVDVYSANIVNGKPVQRKLDKTTDVEIDSTSTRLSPLGDHTFTYKIFCNLDPCMTQFVAGFNMGKTDDGVTVMVRLPFTIYSCKKQKDCRKRALQLAGVK